MSDTKNPYQVAFPVNAWREKVLSQTQTKPVKKVVKRDQCLTWLQKTWADDNSTLRRCQSVVVLIIFSFLGSAIFYGIENSTKNFWQCLSYVNSIYTTIGYGTVKPDTTWGQVFTIFYAILGVPIMMIAASDLGLIMMYWIGKVWVQVRRAKRFFQWTFCRCCMKHNAKVAVIKADDSVLLDGKEDKLPLSFAAGILLLWLVLSSLYFQMTSKDDWSFFIAFYFFFISVATIGLGDYVPPESAPRIMADYAFIIGGLSLFSLCVRLFILKIETIDDKVAQDIIKEYIASLEETYAFDEESGRMEQSEREQRAVIRRMIRKKGGCLLRFFIGKRVEAKMLKQYKKRANMRMKATQTTATFRNVAALISPEMADAQTMAGESFILDRRGFKGKVAKNSFARSVPRNEQGDEFSESLGLNMFVA